MAARETRGLVGVAVVAMLASGQAEVAPGVGLTVPPLAVDRGSS